MKIFAALCINTFSYVEYEFIVRKFMISNNFQKRRARLWLAAFKTLSFIAFYVKGRYMSNCLKFCLLYSVFLFYLTGFELLIILPPVKGLWRIWSQSIHLCLEFRAITNFAFLWDVFDRGERSGTSLQPRPSF